VALELATTLQLVVLQVRVVAIRGYAIRQRWQLPQLKFLFSFQTTSKVFNFMSLRKRKKNRKGGGRRFETCFIGWQKCNNTSSLHQH